MAVAAAIAAVDPIYGLVGMGLASWSYDRLIREVLFHQDSTIQWCKDMGLLAHRMTCHGCGGDMKWEATPEAQVDGYR